MIHPRYYILAIYIADRPYKIGEGFALDLLKTSKWKLEQKTRTMYIGL